MMMSEDMLDAGGSSKAQFRELLKSRRLWYSERYMLSAVRTLNDIDTAINLLGHARRWLCVNGLCAQVEVLGSNPVAGGVFLFACWHVACFIVLLSGRVASRLLSYVRECSVLLFL